MALASPVPRALSEGEESFLMHCECYGLRPHREFQFDPTRKYRFDFAWPTQKVAVEVEGGTSFGKSRHSRGKGFENDCRKYNLAASKEWLVYRFTTEMVRSGEAIDVVRKALA